MALSPSTHFVSFSQGVLYRSAGVDLLWPHLAKLAAIGAVFFLVALARFRRTIAS